MAKAKTSDEALAAFNPRRERSREEEGLWVDLWEARGERELGRVLERQLKARDDLLYALVLGHRGAGKTTELHRAADKLRETYLVRTLAIDAALEMDDVALTDLVLVLIRELIDLATSHSVEVPGQLLEDLDRWGRTVIKTRVKQAGLDLSGPLGVLDAVIANLRVGAQQREEVRKVFEPVLTDLLRIAEHISINVRVGARAKGLGDVLLMVDGLDRMRFSTRDGLSSYEELLVLNAPQLQRLRVNLVMVAPVGLGVQSRADQHWQILHVSNVKVRGRDGELKPANRDALVRLVAERAELDALFEDGRAAVEAAAEWSGGNVRDLLRIIFDAANLDFSDKLSTDTLRRAARRYGSDLWARTRGDDERALLESVGAGHIDLAADEPLQRMLQLGLMLHYRNEKHWCAVHPCVRLVRGFGEPEP